MGYVSPTEAITPVSMSQGWIRNQISVTPGNIVGGALCTGPALWRTHSTPPETASPEADAAIPMVRTKVAGH
jgi:hypothetical protein